jgi:SAM-dependent methyltransferase
MEPLERHQIEIQENLRRWQAKPLLREIYARFYDSIVALIEPRLSGAIVEIGSGIAQLKTRLPGALATDLFPNPWLDVVCDGYDLPFAAGSLSHLVLFDVFHHLRQPNAFLREARRVLAPGGRVILFEPYISLSSAFVYGFLHPEPIGWRQPIALAENSPRPRDYYAAQGNATRLFFREEIPGWPEGWRMFHRSAFSCFAYLLSGGYSRPAFYPASWLGAVGRLDRGLSRWPELFGGRCLIGLESQAP